MQETSDIEVSGVLQKSIVSSPKELASDLEEGVLVLLSGVMEVAGDQAVGSVTSMLQVQVLSMRCQEMIGRRRMRRVIIPMTMGTRKSAPTWQAGALENVGECS